MRFEVHTPDGTRVVDGAEILRAAIAQGLALPDDHVRVLPNGDWYRIAEHPALQEWFEEDIDDTAQVSQPNLRAAWGDPDEDSRVTTAPFTPAAPNVGADAPIDEMSRAEITVGAMTHSSIDRAVRARAKADEERAPNEPAPDIDSDVDTAQLPKLPLRPARRKKKARLIAGANSPDWTPELHQTETQTLSQPSEFSKDADAASGDEPVVRAPAIPSNDNTAVIRPPDKPPEWASGISMPRDSSVSGDAAAVDGESRPGRGAVVVVLLLIVLGAGVVVLLVTRPDIVGLANGDTETFSSPEVSDSATTGERGASRDETDDPDGDRETGADGEGGDAPSGSDVANADGESDDEAADPAATDLAAERGLVWDVEAPTPEALASCPDGSQLARRELAGDDWETACVTEAGHHDGPRARWRSVDGEPRPVWIKRYRGGQLHGTATHWAPDSARKLRELHYANGVLHGPTGEWSSTGQLEVIGMYSGGLRDGLWIEQLRDLEGAPHLFARCYALGNVSWTVRRSDVSWPEAGAVGPAQAPDVFERECPEHPGTEANAGPAEIAAAGELDALPVDPWEPGTRWIYRVSRGPRPGRTDEASELTYYVEREVVRDDPLPKGGIHAILEESGGHLAERVRAIGYFVEDGCLTPIKVPRGERIPVCLKETDAVYTRRIGERTVAVRELTPEPGEAPEGSRILLAPDIGIALIEGRDRRQRPRRVELIGFERSDDSAGLHSTQPRICDWKATQRPSQGQLDLELSGEHGFARLVGGTDTSPSAEIRIAPVDGDGPPPYSGHYDDLELMQAKTWLPPDGHAEYILLHLENAGRIEFVIHRLVEGEVSSDRLAYERPAAGALGAVMMAAPDSCFIRVLWRSGGTSRVRDLVPTSLGLMDAGGSLTTSPTPPK